jgi:hypothetical protein
MSNPLAVPVYVGRIGVPGAIAVRGLAAGPLRLTSKGARTLGRDVPAAKHPATATVEASATATAVTTSAPLCQSRDRT